MLLVDLEVASRERNPINPNTVFKKIHMGSPNGMKTVSVCTYSSGSFTPSYRTARYVGACRQEPSVYPAVTQVLCNFFDFSYWDKKMWLQSPKSCTNQKSPAKIRREDPCYPEQTAAASPLSPKLRETPCLPWRGLRISLGDGGGQALSPLCLKRHFMIMKLETSSTSFHLPTLS